MKKSKDSVKRQLVIHASLQEVWDALTKEKHLNRWYTKHEEIDFRVGGRGYMNHGWGATSEGVFTEIVPMERFVLQSLDGDFTTITSLEKVDDGILVSIEYQASYIGEMDNSTKENMMFGTGQFLQNLKSVYENNTDLRATMWKTTIGILHTSSENKRGTKVVQVKDGSAAKAAGLKHEDIIVALDGEKIEGYESFEKKLNEKSVNHTVTLTIIRNEKKMQIHSLVHAYPVPY